MFEKWELVSVEGGEGLVISSLVSLESRDPLFHFISMVGFTSSFVGRRILIIFSQVAQNNKNRDTMNL